MYVVKEKKGNTLKVVLIVLAILAVIGAGVAAFMWWRKKKKNSDKKFEKEIDAAIDAAFAEDESIEDVAIEIV